MLERIRREAEAIGVSLHAEKTRTVTMTEPGANFAFLGFEFRWEGTEPEDRHPPRETHGCYRRARTCPTKVACRIELARELNKIADEVCTPGSRLHRLATTP